MKKLKKIKNNFVSVFIVMHLFYHNPSICK